MSVTINAHQLKLLLDQTADHMGPDNLEPLYGIRLDVDAQYVYAVATDRYTIAAARYHLNQGEQGQEPWAALLPAENVGTIREWLCAMKGANQITLSLTEHPIDHEGTRKHLLVFESARDGLNIATNTALEYPDWRGLLRGIAAQTIDGQPFPALNTDLLPRWSAIRQSLHTRVTADNKPILLFGENFIGAQMPTRGGGIGPADKQTFDAAHSLWLWTLAAGSTDVDMASLPQPEPSDWEATKSVEETAANLLRGVLDSTSNAFDMNYFDGDRDAWYAHLRSGVSDWMAYRYLDALHQVDPRAAQAVVNDTAEQLDSGELGEWAYDMAEQSGHNPKQWHDDYEARLAKQMAEEPRKWAVRLAIALNDARQAEIPFHVDDNPFVAYDADTGEWKAIKPQPAEETAVEPATT